MTRDLWYKPDGTDGYTLLLSACTKGSVVRSDCGCGNGEKCGDVRTWRVEHNLPYCGALLCTQLRTDMTPSAAGLVEGARAVLYVSVIAILPRNLA